VLCLQDSPVAHPDLDPTRDDERSEEQLPAGEDLVQCILKVRRRIGKLLSHLIDVFLEALLDLLSEEIFERSIAEPFVPSLREVRDEIRDEGA
jgi:hypothetical protein